MPFVFTVALMSQIAVLGCLLRVQRGGNAGFMGLMTHLDAISPFTHAVVMTPSA